MIERIGDWSKAAHILRAGGASRMHKAISLAVHREAHRLRREIVVGLTTRSKDLKPLSPLTRAARRLAGFRGTKPLIRTGDLRNSISVFSKGDRAFVGVARTAAGERTVNLAKLHEYGSQPFVIPITPKMRRYLGVLFEKERGRRRRRRPSSTGAGVVVIQIPSRPFMRLAFERWRKTNPQRRIMADVAKQMGWSS